MTDQLDQETHEQVFRNSILPRYRLADRTSFDRPRAILLAGQPGSGKGSLEKAVKRELAEDVVTVRRPPAFE